MKTTSLRFLLMIAVTVPACLARRPDGNSPTPSSRNSQTPSSPEKQVVFQLVVTRKSAESHGFTFEELHRYFARLKLSKHEWPYEWHGDEFVIGMAELPSDLRHILRMRLANDRGEQVPIEQVVEVTNLRERE